MANISDGFKDIFMAGIGAMAYGAEKSKDIIDQLIEKGEMTVEQGKQINAELKHQAVNATSTMRDDILAAQIAAMSKEEREDFTARVARMAEEANAKDPIEVEAEVVEPEEAEEPEPAASTEDEAPASDDFVPEAAD